MGNRIIYHTANVGNIKIGKQYPIRIQSMLNTTTTDLNASVAQILQLKKAGCELVRLTTRNVKEAEMLYNIKDKLIQHNCNIPIIADIHFNPKVAEIAARYVEKIRINPGNYIDKKSKQNSFTAEDTKEALKRATENISKLVNICQQYNTAIRIGSNQGSLSDRIIYHYGDTAIGMVQSVLEFIKIFKSLNFYNLVLSLKSSNPLVMTEANRILHSIMLKSGEYYPLHLGVTESGAGIEARIKSALGIGSLLYEGIGDTIRVSLSEPPEQEINPAKIIASIKEKYTKNNFDNNNYKEQSLQNKTIKNKYKTKIISFDIKKEDINNEKFNQIDISGQSLNSACAILNRADEDKPIILKRLYLQENFIFNTKPTTLSLKKKYYNPQNEEDIIIVAFELGYLLLNYNIYAIETDITTDFILTLFQACKIRLSKPEYISCPTCGRTEFDLINTLADIKTKTAHLKDITIGVMGCIVNGPGEMRGADYGVLGAGKGKVILYKDGKVASPPLDAKNAGNKILELIEKDRL